VTLFQSEGIDCRPRRSPGSACRDVPALEAIAQSTLRRHDHRRVRGARSGAHRRGGAVAGDERAATWPGLAQAARALAGVLPEGRYQEIPAGADHGIPADETAVAVRSFYLAFSMANC